MGKKKKPTGLETITDVAKLNGNNEHGWYLDKDEKQASVFVKDAKQVIRDFRIEKSWTQEEMAKHMGVSQQEISKMESQEGNISATQLYKLKALGLDVERFFAYDKASDDLGSSALQMARELWDGGMRAVFPKRLEGLQALMPHVQRERLGIHIVGSSLQGLRIERAFLDALEKRVRAGVPLKVLIGHPAFVNLRAWVEGRPAQAINLEIVETSNEYYKKLRRIACENKIGKKEKQVQFRVALNPPTIFAIFLMSQQRALINPYSLTIEAFSTASFLVASTRRNDCVFKQYYKHHFENAWYCDDNLGREVSIDIEDKRMNPDQVNNAQEKFSKALDSVREELKDRNRSE